MRDPYRAALETQGWSVTMRCRCPYPYGYADHTVIGLQARDEDDAVRKALRRLEEQGFEVLATIEASPMVTGGEGGG